MRNRMPTAEDLGLPEWSDDPVDRLRHTVAAFEASRGDEMPIIATSNVAGLPPRTGLTWDDLRDILALLDGAGY
jgi:hypothetical protein